MFSTTTLSLFGTRDNPGLLDMVHEGRLVVPRFQRPWVWTHARSLALVRSIARTWPAGSLLLMEGDRGFPADALHSVAGGAVAEPDYAILDGQQRLTALYLTLNGLHPRHTFLVNLGAIASRGSAIEDDFEFWTRRRWLDTYPTRRDQAAAGLIPVDEVASDAQFVAWVAELPEVADRDAIVDARQSELGGLSSYQFPVSIISRHAPLEVLTNVFVTINQQGLRLSVFDLMVAKSWLDPSSSPPGFDLRLRWNQATGVDVTLAEHPLLANFDVDEVTPLRLVKLLASPSGSVSNADIINLAGSNVRTHYPPALKALEATLTFLQDRAGVIPECLPSETGIVPIAFVLAHRPGAVRTANTRDKLLRWFWASTLLQRYGRGGTNTLVVSDANELYGWAVGSEPEPGWITSFWTQFTPSVLLETQPTNEVLLRGILCLQNLVPAVDWETGVQIVTLGRAPAPGGTTPASRLEQHHVFPSDNPLPDTGGKLEDGEDIPADPDLILNRALLLNSTNRSLHATPANALSGRGIDLAHVQTHMIDPGTLSSWDDFVRSRVASIRSAVVERLPLPEAGEPE